MMNDTTTRETNGYTGHATCPVCGCGVMIRRGSLTAKLARALALAEHVTTMHKPVACDNCGKPNNIAAECNYCSTCRNDFNRRCDVAYNGLSMPSERIVR